MALYNILLASFSGIMYAFKLVHGKGLMTISQKFWMKALEKRNNHDVGGHLLCCTYQVNNTVSQSSVPPHCQEGILR